MRLRVTGVPTTTGIIHDFMMLNPLPPRHATMRELSAGPPELQSLGRQSRKTPDGARNPRSWSARRGPTPSILHMTGLVCIGRCGSDPAGEEALLFPYFLYLTLRSSPAFRRGMPGSSQLSLDLHLIFGTSAIGHSGRHSIGTSIGAPWSLTKKTNIFAGLVVLAFRPTT